MDYNNTENNKDSKSLADWIQKNFEEVKRLVSDKKSLINKLKSVQSSLGLDKKYFDQLISNIDEIDKPVDILTYLSNIYLKHHGLGAESKSESYFSRLLLDDSSLENELYDVDWSDNDRLLVLKNKVAESDLPNKAEIFELLGDAIEFNNGFPPFDIWEKNQEEGKDSIDDYLADINDHYDSFQEKMNSYLGSKAKTEARNSEFQFGNFANLNFLSVGDYYRNDDNSELVVSSINVAGNVEANVDGKPVLFGTIDEFNSYLDAGSYKKKRFNPATTIFPAKCYEDLSLPKVGSTISIFGNNYKISSYVGNKAIVISENTNNEGIPINISDLFFGEMVNGVFVPDSLQNSKFNNKIGNLTFSVDENTEYFKGNLVTNAGTLIEFSLPPSYSFYSFRSTDLPFLNWRRDGNKLLSEVKGAKFSTDFSVDKLSEFSIVNTSYGAFPLRLLNSFSINEPTKNLVSNIVKTDNLDFASSNLKLPEYVIPSVRKSIKMFTEGKSISDIEKSIKGVKVKLSKNYVDHNYSDYRPRVHQIVRYRDGDSIETGKVLSRLSPDEILILKLSGRFKNQRKKINVSSLVSPEELEKRENKKMVSNIKEQILNAAREMGDAVPLKEAGGPKSLSVGSRVGWKDQYGYQHWGYVAQNFPGIKLLDSTDNYASGTKTGESYIDYPNPDVIDLVVYK